MPWCPRCDEVFPEGPVCPRCSARLVDRDRSSTGDALESLPEFPSLKVSRRYRRAFDRLSGPKPPSIRVLAVAVTTLVFAVGFLLGRVATVNPGTPTVGGLLPVRSLPFDDVSGSAVYVLWSGEPLVTVAENDLYSGEVTPRARFSLPFDSTSGVKTELVSLGGSVALVASNGERSFVAFVPKRGAPHAWIPGSGAAWEAFDRLLVRHEDGSVVRWSVSNSRVRTKSVGHAQRLLQTPTGAWMHSDHRFPSPERLLAVSADERHAIVDRAHPKLWDGTTMQTIRVNAAYRAIGAAFEPNGDRAALVLRDGGRLTLAVVDAGGNAALKPLGARTEGCAPAPRWDASGRWIYVSTGNGTVLAAEAGGGRVEVVHTRHLGCGVAWVPSR